VLGFSQGVAMSMRWAVEVSRNPSLGAAGRVHRHVLWAGGLAHDVPDDALRHTWRDARVEVVWGERDRFASETARDAMRARFSGLQVVPHVRTFEGGHRLDAALLETMLRE
jgi:dienelactone hydrolase